MYQHDIEMIDALSKEHREIILSIAGIVSDELKSYETAEDHDTVVYKEKEYEKITSLLKRVKKSTIKSLVRIGWESME